MAEGILEASPVEASENLQHSSLPEVKLEKKELYHGSRSSDITKFNSAEETTIGQGLYLTSDIDAAAGYAKRRSNGEGGLVPSVYRVEVTNLRMADLRTMEGAKLFADLLKQKLLIERGKPDLHHPFDEIYYRALQKIKTNSFRSLKDLTEGCQDLVTQALRDQGFDGLIGLEGGEGDEVGNHDSYVVFDPSKVEIKSKEAVKPQ